MIGVPITSREQWLDLRSKNIGSSDVAALFDCSPYISRYALWKFKAGKMPDPFVDGPRPKWGRRLEEVIAEAVYEDLGIGPARRLPYITHPAVRGMGCTLDFLIDRSNFRPETDGVLEVKNVDWLVRKKSWGDEPPMHILLQLQHQLACTGLGWGVVAALVGGNELVHWRYDRRPKLIAEIERRVADFWASIDVGDEPPIDGSKSTYAAVKAMLPAGHGDNSAIECDDLEFADLCAGRVDAKERQKELSMLLSEVDAKLINRLNGARCGYGMGWTASIIEVAGKPERVAAPGEIIPGRKGGIRVHVKEMTS